MIFMYLSEILRLVVEREGIPESEIIWDEVHWFEEEQERHGSYMVEIHEDEDGKIESITGNCKPELLIKMENCSHYNAPCVELGYSIFYQRDKTLEQDIQKERRKGTLNLG